MKRNVTLFIWLIAFLGGLSALLNGFFVFQQIMLNKVIEEQSASINIKTTQDLQTQWFVQNLLKDLLEYGKKQPAIFSVLSRYGILQNSLSPESSSKTSVTP